MFGVSIRLTMTDTDSAAYQVRCPIILKRHKVTPLLKVQQLTFIVDCLDSKSFIEALKTLGFEKQEIEKMCLNIQKILITEATCI